MLNPESLQSIAFDSSRLDRFSQANMKTPENVESVKKLAVEFEAIFLEIVLKSMRESVQKSNFVSGGNGEAIFQSMLDSEYAKSLANQAPTGLASTIQEHLLGLMSEVDSVKDNFEKKSGLSLYSKEALNSREIKGK